MVPPLKIASIGGGPAGLYLGILMRQRMPSCRVTVYERGQPNDTFGFGVVFSDATLGQLAAADATSHAAITERFARWDDIEVNVGGAVLRSTGHGFCGIERRVLLGVLQARAKEVGVEVIFGHPIDAAAVAAISADNDVVVAADGVASLVRTERAAQFLPTVDLRHNRFVWLGTTVPYNAFTFIFKQTSVGLFRVHAYRYSESGSTFIVECTDDTWSRAGFDGASEDETIAILERLFAEELGAHRLIKNRSIWRQFPTVRCNHWSDGNIVLLGDAVHTAHFSIGSGTKLAMEDSIALADALVDAPTGRAGIVEALANYERARRPVVESLQAAAQASLEWFEHTERYMKLSPEQFTYHLMTRSLRVSHASMAKRDPALVQALAKQVKPAAHLDIASGVRVTLAADDSAFDGVVAAATRALSNGARMIIVEGGTGDVARIGAAERIRFELGATVAITLDAGSRIDRDALIVAGRVDLVLP